MSHNTKVRDVDDLVALIVIDELLKQSDELKADLSNALSALRYYADALNWEGGPEADVKYDTGSRAKDALSEIMIRQKKRRVARAQD